MFVLFTKQVNLQRPISVPNNAVCDDVQRKVQVTNRTTNSITLNLIRLSNITNDSLCVQHDEQIYTPAEDLVTILGLKASKNYTFSVILCVIDSANRDLRSDLGCSFWVYTCKITQISYS